MTSRSETLWFSGGRSRVALQRFGGFLAGMVIPNISAFIAWGLITAFFIPTGWWPNETLAKLVGPMINFLLPILIGYTGGTLVYGQRGGVAGAIATAGVAIGSSVPMFIGAMIMGPLGAGAIKRFDRLVEGKIPTGFEMLTNNFSAGILGGILAVFGFLVVEPVVSGVSHALAAAAAWVTERHLLPLIAILIEPGKVLFLNNAINHGVLAPLGVEQAKEAGKSIFFLLETNPGPGLGVLLAYWLFGKGQTKQSAPGAIVIQFLGGIHEIYFPYILMRPVLLLAVIGGGMAADTVFMLTHAGLVATPSPGSIIAEIVMTPKGGLVPVLSGILTGAAVSFAIASPLVRRAPEQESTEEHLDAAKALTQQLKHQATRAQEKAPAGEPHLSPPAVPDRIYFACEAGMGSSAMGASILNKYLKDAGFRLAVEHKPVNQLPADAQMIFTQKGLVDRARQVAPHAHIYVIDNFLDKKVYEQFIQQLKQIRE
ncbi:MAG: PTS mannitol transporter subunit IICB [Kyrpidia sp.]|nr:PTS mannitol transporter subunit IICB [Kyrpidia sp.]